MSYQITYLSLEAISFFGFQRGISNDYIFRGDRFHVLAADKGLED